MYKEAGDSLLGVFCLFGDGNSLLGVDWWWVWEDAGFVVGGWVMGLWAGWWYLRTWIPRWNSR